MIHNFATALFHQEARLLDSRSHIHSQMKNRRCRAIEKVFPALSPERLLQRVHRFDYFSGDIGLGFTRPAPWNQLREVPRDLDELQLWGDDFNHDSPFQAHTWRLPGRQARRAGK